MRVLIFDDDAAIGRAVVRTATMAGLSAVAVADAVAFEQHFRDAGVPQVVILDLQLNDTDGIAQLRRLADWKFAGVLVLMSGFDSRVLGTAQSLGQTLGLKIETVLEKPLRLPELERLFQRMMANSEPPSPKRLREAIANDEMSLDFQPVVTRSAKELVKLEALIRWDSPISGRISPASFIPVVESDRATIDALTEWLIGAAIESYQVLAEIGVSVPLAVNISTRNLHDVSLPDRIGERLQAGGMPAENLCLEITESAAYEDPIRTMDILSRIRLKGISLSIDDFGTGFSSLHLLRRMPFTEIKIDQSFVRDMTSSRDSRLIVKSIIDLAANMEMACVAEGVETVEAADLLEQLGGRQLQGYFIARPMPIESIPAWRTMWMQGDSKVLKIQTSKPPESAASAPLASVSLSTGAIGNGVRLSPRQIEVMRVLAEGRTVKEIARRLNIGIGTVKVHLALAYTALGAHNRVEAIRLAGPKLLSQPNEGISDQAVAGAVPFAPG